MGKRKKRNARQKKQRRTNHTKMYSKKIINSIVNEIIENVVEIVNPTDYFNIYKISTDEIQWFIELNVENVEYLNQLRVEKIKKDILYTTIYIRKEKQPNLDHWTHIIMDNDEHHLVSNLIIQDIKKNIPETQTNEKIATLYIKNNANMIDTILYIIDPNNLKKKKPILTEDQKRQNEIRNILDKKNEAFNNRLKQNPSIMKLKQKFSQNNKITKEI